MERSPHLGKVGLVLWLLGPVVVVAILWTQMDRSRGKPDPRLIHAHPDSVEQAGATPTAAPEPAPKGSEAQPRMVEPESLAQGFVIVVEDQAKLASAASPIYLASSHNGWNPGDPSRKLTQRSDGRWQIVMSKPTIDSRIGFKFTRGNWDTEELDADLKVIDNRLLPLLDASKIKDGEAPIIEFVVPKWGDQRPRGAEAMKNSPYRAIKVAGGRISRLQVVGGGVPVTRDLLVWLPPGYDDEANAARTYPVLYMNDGQNIFEAPAGVPGEWGADETATKLIKEGAVEPMIIVGIPNAGADRVAEYLPVAVLADVTPRGDAYVGFVVREVMPRVERAFRVKTGPEHTAMGGSSLGGLISLYAGMKHPGVFGKVLAESPSVRLRGQDVWRLAFDGFTKGPRVIVMAMGGKEMGDGADAAAQNESLVASYNAFKDWLAERKIGEEFDSMIDDEAAHNEGAWAERFPRALKALFPAGGGG